MKPSALAVLALLRARPNGITDQDAIRELHQTRLAARISDLRAAGFDVTTDWESRGRVHWARYRLVEQPRFAPTSGVQEALL